MNQRALHRQAYLLLAAVILLWGINWPIMKVGLTAISPLWFAAARALLGAATLFALLGLQGRLVRPTRRDLPVLVSIGLVQVAGAMALIHFGLTLVEAGRSAILAYTFPLWVAPLAVLVLHEPLTRARIVGLVFGLAGVAVLFNPLGYDFSQPGVLLGNGLLIGASLCWAVAVVHIRGHDWQALPVQLAPWQLLIGGLALVPVAFAAEGDVTVAWSPGLLAVLAYNGAIASAFCFWAHVTAARQLPAISTALGSLGVPVTGMLASAWWLDEALTAGKLAGLALILFGVALVSIADVRKR